MALDYLKAVKTVIDGLAAQEWFALHPVLPQPNPICPKCHAQTIRRVGRFGHFYGCSRFPGCDGARSV